MTFEIDVDWNESDFHAAGSVRAVDRERDLFLERLRHSVAGGFFVLHVQGRQMAIQTRVVAAEAGDKWPTIRVRIDSLGASEQASFHDLAPQNWSPSEVDAIEPLAIEALLIHGFSWDGDLLQDGQVIVGGRSGRDFTLGTFEYEGSGRWTHPSARRSPAPTSAVDSSLLLEPSVDACVIAAMHNLPASYNLRRRVDPRRVRDDIGEADVERGESIWEKLQSAWIPEEAVSIESRTDHFEAVSPGLQRSTYFRVVQYHERLRLSAKKRHDDDQRRLLARARRMALTDGVFTLVFEQKYRGYHRSIPVPTPLEALADRYSIDEIEHAERRALELLKAGSRYRAPGHGDHRELLETLRAQFPDFTNYSISNAMDYGARINR